MSTASLGLSLMAGVLSVLSPCVLPLLPIVLGTAAGEHRYGPVALAAGLALSFTAIGLFVATAGFALGIDEDVFRSAGAALLIGFGVIIAVPFLQERFAVAAAPVSNWVASRLGGFSSSGIAGQFGVGLLLGTVWSPCSGPTLGAAAVLAAQGQRLGEVALTMILFGLGAALPLLVLGMLSREAMLRAKARAKGSAPAVKLAMGVLLAAIGVAILSGYDKRLESMLVDVAPDWLTRLTTSF
jgi:cytochrome c biogenesis protein CcdA